MKVVVDNKIPYIKEAIEKIADEVIYVAGKDFTPELVRDADALIIRTRTQCNRHLLEGSNVRFIATATIGYDHIDTEYCRGANIEWRNAPGCNATSVAQYIESVLLLVQERKQVDLHSMTIGIVGVGNVGSKIETVAHRLGMKVLMNDLPRAAKEGKEAFADLNVIAKECDIITFHTPLHQGGEYKTLHLANETFFQSLKRKPIIINTSRGEVIDTQALIAALDGEKIADAIIDVWEDEPKINLALLKKVFIGTPHIAGYSADGKANATQMALEALCQHFKIEPNFKIAPPAPETSTIHAPSRKEALLQIYNPVRDSNVLKENPNLFEQLRGDYPLRREEKAYTIVLKANIE